MTKNNKDEIHNRRKLKVREQREKWFSPKTIYFVRSENRKIKIGITSNLEQRLKTLSSMSPVKLELLAHCKGSTYTEQDIHRQFKQYHSHGEWFDEVPEIIEFINTWVENAGKGNIIGQI